VKLHAKIESGLDTVIHGWLKNSRLHDPLSDLAHKLGFKACFAAGTPLLTPEGSKSVEEFRVGDLVLSRSEHDAAGAIRPQRVEAVHVREALVWELTLGRETIRTTAEHPFWVAGRGWTPANLLREGDRLVGADGIGDTGEEIRGRGHVCLHVDAGQAVHNGRTELFQPRGF